MSALAEVRPSEAAADAIQVAKTETKARLDDGAAILLAAAPPRAHEAVAAVSARAMLCAVIPGPDVPASLQLLMPWLAWWVVAASRPPWQEVDSDLHPGLTKRTLCKVSMHQ